VGDQPRGAPAPAARLDRGAALRWLGQRQPGVHRRQRRARRCHGLAGSRRHRSSHPLGLGEGAPRRRRQRHPELGPERRGGEMDLPRPDQQRPARRHPRRGQRRLYRRLDRHPRRSVAPRRRRPPRWLRQRERHPALRGRQGRELQRAAGQDHRHGAEPERAHRAGLRRPSFPGYDGRRGRVG
jgi:hypothetical protein